MPMERTASVEDMVGNLWKLGRTPSQAEFEQFFSNIAQVGSQQNLAAAAQAAATANNGATNGDAGVAGIPRVASIDLLRKMMMNQPQVPGLPSAAVPTVPNMMPHMGTLGMPNVPNLAGAAAFGAFPGTPGIPGAGLPVAPPAVPPVTAAEDAKRRKPAPKKPAAKKATPEKKTGKKRAATPEDGSNDSDSEDDESDGTKGKTTDEIRRQRRMLSNRESARRSRRRKLEHVAVLEGQIAAHKAENAQVMERLREMEQRAESAIRENAGLKAEVDRLTAALREAAAGAGSKAMERSSSLQRIASAGTLAKSTLGDGTASPQIGGDDSPRGFVPFRSLQSYENLLSLQAGAQTR